MLATVKSQIALFLDTRAVLEATVSHQESLSSCTEMTAIQQSLEARLQRNRSRMSTLYEDYKGDILTLEEYQFAKERYRDEMDQIDQQLRKLKRVPPEVDKVLSNTMHWKKILEATQNADTITQEMIEALIVSILVENPTSIVVVLKFRDEIEKLLAASAQCGQEVA